jgi:hypothetical protein
MRVLPSARTVAKASAALGVAWLAGAALVRRRTYGGPEADAFSAAAVFGGVEHDSRATALRSGRALAVCGGVQLDLRGATLDPGGARLRLAAHLGGIDVKVRPEWAVAVTGTTIAGGIDTHATPPEELPPDAPSLVVIATAVMGGVTVRVAD